VAHAGIGLDRKIGTLSGGERAQVALELRHRPPPARRAGARAPARSAT
jgi:hypothetical protein